MMVTELVAYRVTKNPTFPPLIAAVRGFFGSTKIAMCSMVFHLV
jgi:hypothetical protein